MNCGLKGVKLATYSHIQEVLLLLHVVLPQVAKKCSFNSLGHYLLSVIIIYYIYIYIIWIAEASERCKLNLKRKQTGKVISLVNNQHIITEMKVMKVFLRCGQEINHVSLTQCLVAGWALREWSSLPPLPLHCLPLSKAGSPAEAAPGKRKRVPSCLRRTTLSYNMCMFMDL